MGDKALCGNCINFHPIEKESQNPNAPVLLEVEHGECHLLAPLPNGNNFAIFPKVKLDDWCSNYHRNSGTKYVLPTGEV